jgi:hypothetical protein
MLAWSYYKIPTSHVTVNYIPVITANSNVDKYKRNPLLHLVNPLTAYSKQIQLWHIHLTL